MNSSTKIFSVLSLAAAIGKIMSRVPGDDRVNWRGQKLHESGFHAATVYPFPQLKDSKVRQVEKKVHEVCAPEVDHNIVETLSFLVVGLVDIRANVSPEKWSFLDPVLTRAVWCLELFDGKYIYQEVHAKALEKYEKWAA